MMSDFEVHLPDETKTSDLNVKFLGPKDSTSAVEISVCMLWMLMRWASARQLRTRAAPGRST